jgi:Family of unknown function (DUF5670)
MLSLLWIIGIILLIGWLLGLFVFQAGGLIYVLLVIAIICLIIWLVQRGRITR